MKRASIYLASVLFILGAFSFVPNFAAAATTKHYDCTDFTSLGSGWSCSGSTLTKASSGTAGTSASTASSAMSLVSGSTYYLSAVATRTAGTGTSDFLQVGGTNLITGITTVTYTSQSFVANTTSSNIRFASHLTSNYQGNITGICITDTAGSCEPDTTAPSITLTGSTVNLNVGDTYSEPGYSATDNIDGTITGNVVVTGWNYSTASPGTHTLHYNVSDAAGNNATERTRTVIVSAVAPPPPAAPSGCGLGCAGTPTLYTAKFSSSTSQLAAVGAAIDISKFLGGYLPKLIVILFALIALGTGLWYMKKFIATSAWDRGFSTGYDGATYDAMAANKKYWDKVQK